MGGGRGFGAFGVGPISHLAPPEQTGRREPKFTPPPRPPPSSDRPTRNRYCTPVGLSRVGRSPIASPVLYINVPMRAILS